VEEKRIAIFTEIIDKIGESRWIPGKAQWRWSGIFFSPETARPLVWFPNAVLSAKSAPTLIILNAPWIGVPLLNRALWISSRH
jgi:hypothetical protein